mmetsp:Transcript_7530/g.13578  ORF Transcript_7530/g.13578 Transcript_7530/m.13578 type:complete len:296 (-) Transcript_7530:120-1007(-)
MVRRNTRTTLGAAVLGITFLYSGLPILPSTFVGTHGTSACKSSVRGIVSTSRISCASTSAAVEGSSEKPAKSDSEASSEKPPKSDSESSSEKPKSDKPKSKKGGSSSSSTDDFESLMRAADEFAAKKKKKSTAIVADPLEDDLRGLSVQDEADFKDITTGGFEGKRRLDLSLEGRFRQWAGETVALIRAPSKGQKRFVSVFASSLGLVILLFVVTFSLGAIKLKEDVDTAARNARLAKAPLIEIQRYADNYRQRAVQVERLSDLKYYDEDMNDLRLQGIFPKGEEPATLPKAPQP